jgi:vancomycin resistance protein YoaR
VNDHVGPRTVEKGFVPGGAIMDGEFVDQIGGGVSQFATTLYNAAYFGGYELVDYRAHSYYISRYPRGREATLNYPTIDLVVRNSSPYGMLIEATTTDDSVTVTIWGTDWVEVESVTGQPFNVQPGQVRNGFDVVDTRILRFPEGREEREERFTRYLPEN